MISCVTDTVVLVSKGGYDPTPQHMLNHSLTLAESWARLAGLGQITLAVDLQYRTQPTQAGQGRWQVEIVTYYYSLEDLDGREIIAYHWHPTVDNVTYAHLHIGYGAIPGEFFDRLQLSRNHNALRTDVAAAHLPTGPIELWTVLRLAIEQFHVLPRPAHRTDWRSILGE